MTKELRLSAGIALCIHISVLFITGRLPFSSPIFDIERGPSSIEVWLVPSASISNQQLPKEASEPLPQNADLKDVNPETAINPESQEYDAVTTATPKQKEEHSPENSLTKNEFILSKQGAITEARPSYLQNPPPVYPRIARQLGYEGTVVLNAEVLASGKSGRIQIIRSSGYSSLDNAALEAVKKWTFKPASLLNKPVSTWVEIPITFKLKKNESVEILSY